VRFKVSVVVSPRVVKPVAEMNSQSLTGKRLGECLSERARLARKDVIHPFDQVDRRAERGERLRHLDADRAGAEDHDALRNRHDLLR
jgi:hypothetical protein